MVRWCSVRTDLYGGHQPKLQLLQCLRELEILKNKWQLIMVGPGRSIWKSISENTVRSLYNNKNWWRTRLIWLQGSNCLGVVMGMYLKYGPFVICCCAFEASWQGHGPFILLMIYFWMVPCAIRITYVCCIIIKPVCLRSRFCPNITYLRKIFDKRLYISRKSSDNIFSSIMQFQVPYFPNSRQSITEEQLLHGQLTYKTFQCYTNE